MGIKIVRRSRAHGDRLQPGRPRAQYERVIAPLLDVIAKRGDKRCGPAQNFACLHGSGFQIAGAELQQHLAVVIRDHCDLRQVEQVPTGDTARDAKTARERHLDTQARLEDLERPGADRARNRCLHCLDAGEKYPAARDSCDRRIVPFEPWPGNRFKDRFRLLGQSRFILH